MTKLVNITIWIYECGYREVSPQKKDILEHNNVVDTGIVVMTSNETIVTENEEYQEGDEVIEHATIVATRYTEMITNYTVDN